MPDSSKGMEPDKSLREMDNTARFDNSPSCVGMVPVKRLLAKSRFLESSLSLASSVGIVELNRFPANSSDEVRVVSSDSVSGRVP